jgi:hypothetical protein
MANLRSLDDWIVSIFLLIGKVSGEERGKYAVLGNYEEQEQKDRDKR